MLNAVVIILMLCGLFFFTGGSIGIIRLPDFYSRLHPAGKLDTAGQLKEGGDPAGAIGVLDAGARRYPGDADITRAIEQLKTSGSDAELERLRSLGYVE